MKHSVLQLSGSQGGQMDQAGGDSHRIHLPHQGADPFFIPKDIGEIGELAPYIKVRDAQVVPIFMPSGEDVEVSPPPIDLSFIPSVPRAQQDDLPRPGLLAGTAFQDTGIIHVPFLLSEILAADRSQDDIRIDHFPVHLCPQCQRVGHQVVHQAGASLGVAVDGGKRRLVDDGGCASRHRRSCGGCTAPLRSLRARKSCSAL